MVLAAARGSYALTSHLTTALRSCDFACPTWAASISATISPGLTLSLTCLKTAATEPGKPRGEMCHACRVERRLRRWH